MSFARIHIPSVLNFRKAPDGGISALYGHCLETLLRKGNNPFQRDKVLGLQPLAAGRLQVKAEGKSKSNHHGGMEQSKRGYSNPEKALARAISKLRRFHVKTRPAKNRPARTGFGVGVCRWYGQFNFRAGAGFAPDF